MSVFEGNTNLSQQIFKSSQNSQAIKTVKFQLDDETQTKILLIRELKKLQENEDLYQLKKAELSNQKHYQNLLEEEDCKRVQERKKFIQKLNNEINGLKLMKEDQNLKIEQNEIKIEKQEEDLESMSKRIEIFEKVVESNREEIQGNQKEIELLQKKLLVDESEKSTLENQVSIKDQEDKKKQNQLGDLILSIRSQNKLIEQKEEKVRKDRLEINHQIKSNKLHHHEIQCKKDKIKHLIQLRQELKNNIFQIQDRLDEERQKKGTLNIRQQEYMGLHQENQKDYTIHEEQKQTLQLGLKNNTKSCNIQEQQKFELAQKLKELEWQRQRQDNEELMLINQKDSLIQFFDKIYSVLQNFQIQDEHQELIQEQLDDSQQKLIRLKKLVQDKKRIYFNQFQLNNDQISQEFKKKFRPHKFNKNGFCFGESEL